MARQRALTGDVFLSAGVPDDPQRGDYVTTADKVAIREAIRALVALVLSRNGTLVFGGHPAVTPLVYDVAISLERATNVVIYQSEEFLALIPKEVRYFARLHWTPKMRSKADSLTEMRNTMVASRPFAAGVFIGGMDGVEEEFKLFRAAHRSASVFPIASTGGAALNIWKGTKQLYEDSDLCWLTADRRYSLVFQQLLKVAPKGRHKKS